MNYKKIILIAMFVFLLLFAFGCADGERSEDGPADEPAEEVQEYNPKVVDTLRDDFEEIKW
jgi:outer membrane lipoprotein-sorting protein